MKDIIDLEEKGRKVRKHNDLIELPYETLSTIEYKLILVLISAIKQDDTDLKEYTISIKDFMKWANVKSKDYYKAVREAAKNLMESTFEIRRRSNINDEDITIRVAWLSSAIYHHGSGLITVSFNRWLIPYLLEISRDFTQYRLYNIRTLKSSNSLRIYEILKSKQFQQKNNQWILEISVEKLKNTLGLQNEYSGYGQFKQRVLATAQKEIKEKTDIDFEIIEIKENRKVTELKFKVRINDENMVHTLPDIKTDQAIGIGTIKERLLNLKVNPKVVKKIIEKYPSSYLEEKIYQLELQVERGGIENVGAYVAASILKVENNITSPAMLSTPDEQQEELYLFPLKEMATSEEESQQMINQIEANIDQNIADSNISNIVKRCATKSIKRGIKTEKGLI